MATRWLPLLLALQIGCAPSFAIPPGQLPQLGRGTVYTVDNEVEAVPEGWSATLVPREVDGARLMVPAEGSPVQAWLVSDDRVKEAEEGGWTDRPIAFAYPLEGGIGAPGAFQHQLRGDAAPPPAPGQPQVLWVRDEKNRIVEVPLGAVERIEVKGRRGPGATVAIVAGSVAGGVLVIGLSVLAISKMGELD